MQQVPPGAPVQPQGAYAPPQPQTQKKGCGKFAIIGGIAGIVGLVIVAAAGFYFFGASGSKVKSVAHKHLPKGCEVAVRMDMTELMKVKPVKKHVVSAIEEVMKEEGGGRLAAFLIAARLDPKDDVHEVAVCLSDVEMGSDPSYGVIVGGKLLDDDGVIKALDKHDGGDEIGDPKKDGDLLVVKDKEGTYISQSPKDAALLFSSDKKLLKKISKVGDSFEDYDIPLDEQIVGVISSDVISGMLGGLGPLAPDMGSVKKVGRIVVTLTLDPGELGFRMTFDDKSTAKAAKKELEGLFAGLAMAPFGPTSDPAVKKAIKGAEMKTKGAELRLTFPISDDAIEETCEELGEKIREENE